MRKHPLSPRSSPGHPLHRCTCSRCCAIRAGLAPTPLSTPEDGQTVSTPEQGQPLTTRKPGQ